MSGDAMDIDDPRLFHPNIPSSFYAPLYPSAPPQLAGQKRCHSELECIPGSRIANPRHVPGVPGPTHLSDEVPAKRLLRRVAGNVRWAALATLGVAGRHIQKSTASARVYLESRGLAQHTAVLDASPKRRKTCMPGTYPASPLKDDAAIASTIAATAPPKFVAMKHGVPGEDSPFTKLNKLRPAKPAASLLQDPIMAMPVALSTAAMPLKRAETGPTPPESRPTSSHSPPAGVVYGSKLPERTRKVTALPKPTIESVQPRRRGTTLPKPTIESVQPKKTRANYRQPFYPLQVSPNAEPPKSILKKTTRDTEIESLITKAKTVLIESPEDKAVRFTYRQRKYFEDLKHSRARIAARDACELEIEREREEAERAAIEAIALKKRQGIEAEERKERERIEAEQGQERLLKAEENAKKAEAAAEKQRVKEEAKKKAAVEAEERRIAHEATLATKRASLEAADDSFDEDLFNIANIISTLSSDWEEKIHKEMSVKNLAHTVATTADGAELSRRDFGSLLPQEGTSDDPSGWLNDEVVNGFISTIVATQKDRDKHRKGRDVPLFEAYTSAWYTTYKSSGMSKLARWSKRKGISGKKLLKCRSIFFPINTGNHWMLLIISPQFRTIEFLDSLPNSTRPAQFFKIAREWLKMELNSDYKESEWRDLDSESERQVNMNDCGVFTCFNALASAKILPFWLVDATKMNKARRLMAAVLMKGRLVDEFKL